MEEYQVRDKVTVDLTNTVMGNLPYRYFPETNGSEYRAMITNQGCCTLLGVTEKKETFFNYFTMLFRDASHPHHKLMAYVFSGNLWYPVGFGKSFPIANDDLVCRIKNLMINDSNYPKVVKYIEENLFEYNEQFGYQCSDQVVKVLQQDNYQLAYELIKDKLNG